MSGMIDGVNAIFTVEHKRGAMHVDAFRDRRALIETLLQHTPVEEVPGDIVVWLASLHKKIDDAIARIKEEWEIGSPPKPRRRSRRRADRTSEGT